MSVSSKVIVTGRVTEVSERAGTSKATGEMWQRRDVLVVGEWATPSQGLVGSVGFRGDIARLAPQPGAIVTMICEVGTYRDDDTLDFVRYVDSPAAK